MVATADFKEGQVLAVIPNKSTIDVGHHTLPGAVRTGHALKRLTQHWAHLTNPNHHIA